MLKVLRLNKKVEIEREKLNSLISKRDELNNKSKELENSIDEAKTDEDLNLIETEIDKISKNIEDNDKDIQDLEREIENIEEEIKNQDEKQRTLEINLKTEQRGANNVLNSIDLRATTVHEKRARMEQVLQRSEVKEFYQTIADIVSKRSVDNTELLIPNIVIDMINIDMTDVGNLLRLVNVRAIGGTSRIVMSGESPEAIWLDQCASIPELSLDFNMMELDGFKVGGYIAVCNATLEDAFINLAMHVQEQLTKAIAVALDKAIIKGEGASKKQPEGIIPSLATSHKIKTSSKFSEFMAVYAKLPDDISGITAVMTRATYYTYFAGQTVATTSGGQVVAQNSNSARLPDGTPVVFTNNNNIDDGKVLLGDFKKYFLVQRAGTSLARSEHVRFIEDNTVFRATARFDGKPLKKEYWLLLTLTKDDTSLLGTV